MQHWEKTRDYFNIQPKTFIYYTISISLCQLHIALELNRYRNSSRILLETCTMWVLIFYYLYTNYCNKNLWKYFLQKK